MLVRILSPLWWWCREGCHSYYNIILLTKSSSVTNIFLHVHYYNSRKNATFPELFSCFLLLTLWPHKEQVLYWSLGLFIIYTGSWHLCIHIPWHLPSFFLLVHSYKLKKYVKGMFIHLAEILITRLMILNVSIASSNTFCKCGSSGLFSRCVPKSKIIKSWQNQNIKTRSYKTFNVKLNC